MTPLELLKCQQQMAEEKFISLSERAGYIVRQMGLRGLYRGFWVTFNRDILSYGSYFLTFFAIKDYLQDNNKLSHINIMLAGGLAGMVNL